MTIEEFLDKVNNAIMMQAIHDQMVASPRKFASAEDLLTWVVGKAQSDQKQRAKQVEYRDKWSKRLAGMSEEARDEHMADIAYARKKHREAKKAREQAIIDEAKKRGLI